MNSVMLYRCPKLTGRPRITTAQCDRNHERAARADEKPRIRNASGKNITLRNPETESLIWLGPCVGCKGVKSIARQPGAEKPVKFTAPPRSKPDKKSKRRRRHKRRVLGDFNG